MFTILEGAFYNDFEECVVVLLFSIYIAFILLWFWAWYVEESARLAALRAPATPAPSAPATKPPIIPSIPTQPDICTVYPPPRTWPDLPPTFDRTFCLREPEKARQLGLPTRPSFGIGSNPLSYPASGASYFTLLPTKPAQPSTSQRLSGRTHVWHGDHYRPKTTPDASTSVRYSRLDLSRHRHLQIKQDTAATERHPVSTEQVPISIEEDVCPVERVSIEKTPLADENTSQRTIVDQCERNVAVVAPGCEVSLSREIDWIPEASHWSQSTEAAVVNKQEPTFVADAPQEAANPATFDCLTLSEAILAQQSPEPDHSTVNLTAPTMSASSRAQMYCVLWYPKFSNVWQVHSAEWGPFQAFALYCHEEENILTRMDAESLVYQSLMPPTDATPPQSTTVAQPEVSDTESFQAPPSQTGALVDHHEGQAQQPVDYEESDGDLEFEDVPIAGLQPPQTAPINAPPQVNQIPTPVEVVAAPPPQTFTFGQQQPSFGSNPFTLSSASQVPTTQPAAATPAASIFTGLDNIIAQCETSIKESSSKPEASKFVANQNSIKVTSYDQPYRPITVASAPKWQGTATIRFQDQDWTKSDEELLKLSKATWGWSDDEVWQHSEGKELLWAKKPSKDEETAACKDVNIVEERLNSKVIAFKRATVMLRLQALAGYPPSGTTPRLLHQVAAFIQRVDQMLDALNDESTSKFDEGDWRRIEDAVKFFKDHVLQKEYVVRSLRDYYGKKAVRDLENKFNNLGGHFVIYAEVPE